MDELQDTLRRLELQLDKASSTPDAYKINRLRERMEEFTQGASPRAQTYTDIAFKILNELGSLDAEGLKAAKKDVGALWRLQHADKELDRKEREIIEEAILHVRDGMIYRRRFLSSAGSKLGSSILGSLGFSDMAGFTAAIASGNPIIGLVTKITAMGRERSGASRSSARTQSLQRQVDMLKAVMAGRSAANNPAPDDTDIPIPAEPKVRRSGGGGGASQDLIDELEKQTTLLDLSLDQLKLIAGTEETRFERDKAEADHRFRVEDLLEEISGRVSTKGSDSGGMGSWLQKIVPALMQLGPTIISGLTAALPALITGAVTAAVAYLLPKNTLTKAVIGDETYNRGQLDQTRKEIEKAKKAGDTMRVKRLEARAKTLEGGLTPNLPANPLKALTKPSIGAPNIRVPNLPTSGALMGVMTSPGVTSQGVSQEMQRDVLPADITALAKKYESGGRGPGTINSAKAAASDPGGWSYGTYQIETKRGTMARFLEYAMSRAPEFAEPLMRAGGAAAAMAGAQEFRNAWKALAKRDPKGFEKLQAEFIAATNYRPAVATVKSATGTNLDSKNIGIRSAMFSTSVQQGPGGAGNIGTKAVKASGDDAELLDNIYAFRKQQIASLSGGYWSNQNRKNAEFARYDRESSDARSLASSTSPSAAPPRMMAGATLAASSAQMSSQQGGNAMVVAPSTTSVQQVNSETRVLIPQTAQNPDSTFNTLTKANHRAS